MPCVSDYLEPDHEEAESIRVINFLKEFERAPQYQTGPYGDVRHLDQHTDQLCSLCKKYGVKDRSLELQIWWRDHQLADAQRAEKERSKSEKKRLATQALHKLSQAERDSIKDYLLDRE